MTTTLTRKGQVTIPKAIRRTLGLSPGSQVTFELDERDRIVICKADAQKLSDNEQPRDRFKRARGRASIKWTTDELMRLLRGDD